MKFDTKIIIIAVISATFPAVFLPKYSPTTLESIAIVVSYAVMAAMGCAVGLGRDRNGKKIVERDFDPEA